MKQPAVARLQLTGRQGGFAAIAAIFLVVVLAALGAFMLSFSSTQQVTSAQDLLGTRAYLAARSGLEYGIASTQIAGACSGTLPTRLTLDGLTVCVSCSRTQYTEGSTTPTVFRIVSLARSPALVNCSDVGVVGAPGYVERSLSASVEQ